MALRHLKLSAASVICILYAGMALGEPRIDAVRDTLAEPARKTLDRIPDQGRKLLALRSYLRARSLEARWSWTREEIDAYLRSDQYVTAMAAVAAVTKAFELKNPGYTLHVNTDVRSLDEPIDKWNANGSVQVAGAEIDAATSKWFIDQPKAGPDRLRAFLVDWKPATTASLAAPGLTAHGRGQAFDFQIARGNEVIAGADTGAVSDKWDAEGWTSKLAEAVKLSTLPFEGPLKDPNEPWHYDYKPLEAYRPDPKAVAAVAAPSVPPVQSANAPSANVPTPTAKPTARTAKAVKRPAKLSKRPAKNRKAARRRR